MGMLDRALRRLGYIKAQPQPERMPPFLLDDAGMQRWRIPGGLLYYEQADLYRQLSWVQSAVLAVAQTAATTALSVRRRVGEETRDIPNHPLEVLLHKPNPLDSRYELLEATVAARKLTGNAYWWLNRRGPDSPIMEIWPLPTHQVLPVPDGKQYLKGYAFYPESTIGDGWVTNPPHLLEPWEVVHFKSWNPLNRFVGLSPVEAVAIGSAADLKMQEWNANFFGEDNAKVPGILAFADNILQADWDRMKADVRDSSGGTRRSLMMLRNVGKGGVEWVPMAMSQREMEFLQGRQFTKEEIFNLFAPGLASVLDVNATEANATAGKATFIEQSVWPLLCAVAEKISNDVLPVYGRNLVASFDDIRIADRAMALQEQEAYARVHTVDEVRQKYYQSAALGDRRGQLLPVEVERPGGGEATTLPGQPSEIDADWLVVDDPIAGLLPPGTALKREGVPLPPGTALKREGVPLPPGEGLSDEERVIYDAIRPIFARYADEFRDAIESNTPIRYEQLRGELRASLLASLLAAMLESMQTTLVGLELDADPGQISTRAAAWAEQHAGWLDEKLSETTRTVVQGTVSRYLSTPGMTREQLEALLRPALGNRRAETVAITEVSRANAEAVNEVQQLLRDQGIGMIRRWRTSNDERTCPICRPLDGKPESVWAKQFPKGPPGHGRCRCSLTLTMEEA